MPDRSFIGTAGPRADLRPGARKIVEVCLAASSEDRAVLATDDGTSHIAAVILDELECRGIATQAFLLERHGPRPLSKLPTAIGQALAHASVSLLMVQPEPGELGLRAAFVELARQHGLRHAHMPGVDDRAMATGMQADYFCISELQDRLVERLEIARSIHVTTPGGTDLSIRLDPRFRWIRNDGLIRPGTCQNLPSGSLQTTPAAVEGTYVADASIGDWFGQKYGDLQGLPLKIVLRGGRVVSAESDDPSLSRQFLLYIRSNKNGDRVGEIGLGTNTALDEHVGNVLHDQSVPGALITLGGAAALSESGAPWSARTHVPLVGRRCDVDVDGQPIIREGRYTDELSGPFR